MRDSFQTLTKFNAIRIIKMSILLTSSLRMSANYVTKVLLIGNINMKVQARNPGKTF
jgi:hypothetical protein